MAHLILGVAAVVLGATALGLTAWSRRRPGPTRRPSPLRRAELDALLAAEYGGSHHDQDRDPVDRRVTLTSPAAFDEASWQHTVAVVERALDHALVLAGDDGGAYCAAGLRTEIAPAGRAIAWRLPAPVAATAAHLLPHLVPPEVAGWLRTHTPVDV